MTKWVKGLASLGLCTGGIAACAQNVPIEPFAARLARPEAGQVLVAQDVVIVADGSGSMDRNEGFPREKALLESFVIGANQFILQRGSI